MGVPNFSNLRAKYNINKDQWNEIRKNARKIFEDSEASLQCGKKGCGWKKVTDDVRKSCCEQVIFLKIDS